MKIDVSFKKTTRDKRLYEYVNRLEEKSDFVKDAIEFYIRYLSTYHKGEEQCSRDYHSTRRKGIQSREENQ